MDMRGCNLHKHRKLSNESERANGVNSLIKWSNFNYTRRKRISRGSWKTSSYSINTREWEWAANDEITIFPIPWNMNRQNSQREPYLNGVEIDTRTDVWWNVNTSRGSESENDRNSVWLNKMTGVNRNCWKVKQRSAGRNNARPRRWLSNVGLVGNERAIITQVWLDATRQ